MKNIYLRWNYINKDIDFLQNKLLRLITMVN